MQRLFNEKTKCQVCGKLFTKKWMTTHIEPEHQSSESKPIVSEKSSNNNNNNTIKNEICSSPQQQKIDNKNKNSVSTYENCRHLVIGPSNVNKTCYMLKILKKIGDKRPIHIITRSPNCISKL